MGFGACDGFLVLPISLGGKEGGPAAVRVSGRCGSEGGGAGSDPLENVLDCPLFNAWEGKWQLCGLRGPSFGKGT